MDKQILAADAELILNNLAFKKAQDKVDAEILRQLKDIRIDGKKETDVRRTELLLSLKMADYYRAALREMVTLGQLEEHNYEQKNKRKFF